jgi:putative ABC transport system substrate-binding protein
MNRRCFVAALAAGLAAPRVVNAQPRSRRVALVTIADLTRQPLASLVHGLRELGYEEGRSLEFLPSTAGGSYARLGEAAKEAVTREPDVIVTDGSTATRAAKAATWTIPIVMVVGVDPIEHGFVRKLARPEGNITGIATSGQLLSAKRLELLKEILPQARKVGVLWSGESAQQMASLKLIEAAAPRFGLSVIPAEVRKPSALPAAFAALSDAGVHALVPVSSSMFEREVAEIVRLVAVHKIPAVHPRAIWPRNGGLLSYGSDQEANFRRAAVIVDKILKGAKPGDLPVEQPSKFELVINLKAAKALGIEIPKSVLFRADEVIQ